jgi:hypothetical protein
MLLLRALNALQRVAAETNPFLMNLNVLLLIRLSVAGQDYLCTMPSN